MKRVLFVLITIILVSVILTACGNKTNVSTADESSPAETTVVLETTAQGGTIEQDSEGNQITKDSDGKVVSVKDKNGTEVNVTEYLETHSWVEGVNNGNEGSSSGLGAGSDNSLSSKSGKSDSSQGGSSKRDDSVSSGSSDDSNLEGEIPVVIATIPDEDELETLPDF